MSRRDWIIAAVTAAIVLLLVAGVYVFVRTDALRAVGQGIAQLPGVQYLLGRVDAGRDAPDPQAEEWIKSGAALEERGEYREAIRAYEKALELAPDEVKVHLGLSSAYESLEEREQAIAQMERAAEIAGQPARTLRMTKRLFYMAQGKSLEETLEMSASMQGLCHHMPEHTQALEAMLSRKK